MQVSCSATHVDQASAGGLPSIHRAAHHLQDRFIADTTSLPGRELLQLERPLRCSRLAARHTLRKISQAVHLRMRIGKLPRASCTGARKMRT